MAKPGIFEAWGIEMEYMVVRPPNHPVHAVVDDLFQRILGRPGNEFEDGEITWSNELAAHVLEFKTALPFSNWKDLDLRFHESTRRAAEALVPLGGALMGGGCHPTMNPATETKLWPHENREIYDQFHHLFNCRGHGWSNLQSTHLNLSFRGDLEFHRLHSAIRLILPLIPALAASSPVLDGRPAGMQDARLFHYRDNSKRFPCITGAVIPEPIADRARYRKQIYGPIRRAMAPHDPQQILEPEWLNARGAIARFDRGSIEVRLADSQECPTADVAIMAAIATAIRAVEAISTPVDRDEIPTDYLAEILEATILGGEIFPIDSAPYLSLLGLPSRPRLAGDIWKDLLDRHGGVVPDVGRHVEDAMALLLQHGTLATRMLKGLRRNGIPDLLEQLVAAMEANRPFTPA